MMRDNVALPPPVRLHPLRSASRAAGHPGARQVPLQLSIGGILPLVGYRHQPATLERALEGQPPAKNLARLGGSSHGHMSSLECTAARGPSLAHQAPLEQARIDLPDLPFDASHVGKGAAVGRRCRIHIRSCLPHPQCRNPPNGCADPYSAGRHQAPADDPGENPDSKLHCLPYTSYLSPEPGRSQSRGGRRRMMTTSRTMSRTKRPSRQTEQVCP